MNQIIFLVADRSGVRRMTKSLPSIYKDEIVIKVNVNIAPKAFGTPVIEQNVSVEDWASDIDIQDIEFSRNIITAAEANIIRERRLERMKEVLESQGYTVSAKEEEKE